MTNPNSCCYVDSIREIRAIEGADNIELATIGGWNCVVQKGSYEVGQHVIVATTDAVIPEKLSEELNITSYLRKGQRVRTVKLRGVYSECLIIPTYTSKKVVLKVGECMMEELNVYKYEPPAKMVQLSSGRKVRYHENPNFQIYYKFPNAKNVHDMFQDGDEVEITRKIHGTNARYGIVKKSKISFMDKVRKFFGNRWVEYEFVVGSHNVEKGSDSQGYYDTNVWYEMNDKLEIKDKLWEYVKDMYLPEDVGSGLVVYGEIYGAGIQKNYDYGLKDHRRFVVFDITLNGEYLDTDTANWIAEEELGLSYVPVLYVGPYKKEIVDKYVLKNYIEGTKVPHEGVVVKHVSGDRKQVAKHINPEYLTWSEKFEVGDSH